MEMAMQRRYEEGQVKAAKKKKKKHTMPDLGR
jgi:hypothetical protein